MEQPLRSDYPLLFWSRNPAISAPVALYMYSEVGGIGFVERLAFPHMDISEAEWLAFCDLEPRFATKRAA